MKNYCLIRFGDKPDPIVSFMLGLLSVEPPEQMVATDGIILTPFKSLLSLAECRAELAKSGYNFILIDVSEQTDYVQTAGDSTFIRGLLGVFTPQSEDERELELFEKRRIYGEDSLTDEEHEFMKQRMSKL